jgi:cation diffusion facilitator family transporter
MHILASTVFLWRSIIKTISSGVYYQASIWALIAALIALIVKIFLYTKTMRVGKKINSIAVQTNAKDHRNDIIATIGTVIAIALSLVGSRTGLSFFRYSESVSAGITSIFIIKAGIDIISSSAKMLMDAAPDDRTIESLEDTTRQCAGVQELDWLKCRTVGRGILVDLAVEVDADLSVKQAHDLGLNIKKAIHHKFKSVLEVQVHTNPDDD